MREQEVRELYEAYLDVYSNSNKGVSEVEQLNEDFPKQVGDFLKRGGDELRKRLPGVAKVLSPVGTGQGTVTADQQKAKIKPVGEEVENWVNSLIDEGYDLSEYTWDDMYEMYVNLDEGNREENETRMSNVSKLKRRQKKFAAGIVHPDEAGELEGERQDAHKSKRYVPTRGSGVREGYDTFDAILEHLIAEGYADTNESALVIMANMSEEWREEILDEATIRSVTSSSGKRIYKSPEYSSDERTNISKTAHRQKRLKQRHYASTSDARDDQRSFDHEERQENKRRKHPTNIMNAKPGEAEHYGADEGDGYHYDTVKTDRNARKRRASGR